MFGALGLSLLFVCIALVNNGVGALKNTDVKSRSVLNIITGFVILSINITALNKAVTAADYLNIASGFLFGFTYIFIAANMLFKLDASPFAFFSLIVGLYATVMGVLTFAGFIPGSVWMGLLWCAWAVLWLEGFVEITFKSQLLGKVFPYLCLFEAVFAAGIPAILMLLEIKPF